MKLLAITIMILLTSCASEEEVTSRSDLTKEEVLALEIGAERNDIRAMHDLQVHYSFEGMDIKREELHKKLLGLEDYDAMIEEATGLAIDAEKVTDKVSKKRILDEAMALAVRAANKMQVKDVSKDSTVQMIQRDLNKVDSIQ
jgi:hypothetical protein